MRVVKLDEKLDEEPSVEPRAALRPGEPEPLADIIARVAKLDQAALAALLPEEDDLR